MGDDAGAREVAATATSLHDPDDAGAVGVDMLVAQAADVYIQGRYREALRLAELAVARSDRVSDPEVRFLALVHRAAALLSLGHVERGVVDLDHAQRLQSEHGWLDRHGMLATALALPLAEAGRLDAAAALLNEALETSAKLGVGPAWDPWYIPGLAYVAELSGRWADADRYVAATRTFNPSGLLTVWVECIAASLAAGRGELEECDRSLSVAEEHAVDLIGEWPSWIRLFRAMRADAADDPQLRLDHAEAGLRALGEIDGFVTRSRLAAEVASAAADLVGVLHRRRDPDRIADARRRARAAAALAARIDDGRVVPGTASVPWTRVNAAVAEAEATRAEGIADPEPWARIAAAFGELGMRPCVAYALFRGAEAALAVGSRGEAAGRLRSAKQMSAAIGMNVLEGRIEALARAGRIELVPPIQSNKPLQEPPTQWGLSPRERDVLALVAEGRTNGEIAARLFISTKTASVHVTHILDKLGVSTRTEAALIASRAGLLEARSQRQE
jgi:DNA-binding CsgD family transcriptional regulator/tetratricopeptide (TPR) repeat protein